MSQKEAENQTWGAVEREIQVMQGEGGGAVSVEIPVVPIRGILGKDERDIGRRKKLWWIKRKVGRKNEDATGNEVNRVDMSTSAQDGRNEGEEKEHMETIETTEGCFVISIPPLLENQRPVAKEQ